MSTIAQPAPRRLRVGRSAFTGGVFWILVVAVLLAGVVAINVLVLRLNVQLDDLRTPRHGLGVAALAGRVYVIGGGPEPGLTVSSANESLAVG